MGIDHDLEVMDAAALRQEVDRLREGIRLHRDEKGHDRCKKYGKFHISAQK